MTTKEIFTKDIEAIDYEIAKANAQIELFEWIASNEKDKKKNAEILLKVEALKDTNKKNVLSEQMIAEFLLSKESTKTPFL